MKRYVPFLRDTFEPRTLTGIVKQIGRRTRALELSGPQSDGATGSAGTTAAVSVAAAAATGPAYSVFDEFTAAEQILVGTGVGMGGLLNVGQNSVLGRFGGSIDDLAMAASRIVARLAAGNLKACTPAEIMTLLGAADIALDNVTFVRKTANYVAVEADTCIAFLMGGADRSLTLPSNHSKDGKLMNVVDAKNSFHATPTGQLTVAAGAGDTINGAASIVITVPNRFTSLLWSKTDRNWCAG